MRRRAWSGSRWTIRACILQASPMASPASRHAPHSAAPTTGPGGSQARERGVIHPGFVNAGRSVHRARRAASTVDAEGGYWLQPASTWVRANARTYTRSGVFIESNVVVGGPLVQM